MLTQARAVLDQHADAGKLHEWMHQTTRDLGPRPSPTPPSPKLSDAERRVLRLLDSELTLREIGRELYLSVNTVRSHAHTIYRKLGVSCRADGVSATYVNRDATHDIAPR